MHRIDLGSRARPHTHELDLVDRFGQRAAVDEVQEHLQQQDETRATGVDHPGLGQHGQELGRGGERFLGRGSGGTGHSHQIGAVRRGRGRRFGRRAHHREDRALDRLHHRAVGGR